jgi:hypothetical protein
MAGRRWLDHHAINLQCALWSTGGGIRAALFHIYRAGVDD